MSIQTVTRQDPRFNSLIRSRNARWPGGASDVGIASRIELCDSSKNVEEAVQRVIDAKLRPTVRSGGHCYEDFVANNPGGAILDMSLMSDAVAMPGGGYRIGSGATLGQAYGDLYKRHNITLPGGSCGTVGAGGHITGGGYGVLSRLQGITVDWLSAVEIVTVDAKGKATLRKVDAKNDPDLFRAVRGAGGGNFGVITNYYFDELPTAPSEVMSASISFNWEGMTQERFEKIFTTYGHYHETRAKDPETWGLFTIINLNHQSRGRITIGVQFCNPDGTCKDTKVMDEFLGLFDTCNPAIGGDHPIAGMDQRLGSGGRRGGQGGFNGQPQACGVAKGVRHEWIDATAREAVIQTEARAKYKSTYMKKNFSQAEIAVYYKHMTTPMKGPDVSCTVLVDSYGGRTNRPELANETAAAARESVMKLQFLQYWQNAEEDAAHAEWIRSLYTDLYSTADCDQKHLGTPYPNDKYEGCYINYPDADMLEHPYWMELYYGNKGLVPFLQQVKKKYDPNNVFHHAMSIRS